MRNKLNINHLQHQWECRLECESMKNDMKWELMYEFELRRVRNAKQSDELMVGVHFWHTLLRLGYKAR